MRVSDFAIFINDEEGRHPSDKRFYLLGIKRGHLVQGTVTQASKRHIMTAPPLGKLRQSFGPNGNYLRSTRYEFFVVLSQLRHVLAAVWSAETPVEDQDNGLFALIARQLYFFAISILQIEIRGQNGFFRTY
jgi:hypothetical protein